MAPGAPVTVESSPTEVLKSLTPAQHKTWRTTGEIPESKSPPATSPKASTETPTPAAPSPAAKEVAAPAPEKAAVETPAEPAPATPEPKAKGAEARIKDLLADNKRLNAELETARKIPAVAPTKTEKAPVKPSRNDADEKGQPKFATDDEFLDARDKYVAEMASHQTRQDIARETQERQVAEQNRIMQQRMVNQIKISTERHPDFAEVLKIETKDGKTVFNAEAMKAIKTNGMIDSWCAESEMGTEILYFLASRIAEVERIQALNPFAAARELTKLEDKLSATPSTPAPEKKEEPAKGSPTQKVSGAPAPAASVGGKGTAPTDEELAATESGDFKRFQKVANEADWRKKKAS